MGDEAERRSLFRELQSQGWSVTPRGSGVGGKIRCIPPRPDMGPPVFVQHASSDRMALAHVVRQLERSGYVPGATEPVPPAAAATSTEPTQAPELRCGACYAPLDAGRPRANPNDGVAPPLCGSCYHPPSATVPPPATSASLVDDVDDDDDDGDGEPVSALPPPAPGESLPFPAALRRFRRACGWTQRRMAFEVSKHLGYTLSASSINRWESAQPPVRRHYEALKAVFPDLQLHQEPEWNYPDANPPVGPRSVTDDGRPIPPMSAATAALVQALRALNEDAAVALLDLMVSDETFEAVGEALFDVYYAAQRPDPPLPPEQSPDDDGFTHPPPILDRAVTAAGSLSLLLTLERLAEVVCRSGLVDPKRSPSLFAATFSHTWQSAEADGPPEPWQAEILGQAASGDTPELAAIGAVARYSAGFEKRRELLAEEQRRLDEGIQLMKELGR